MEKVVAKFKTHEDAEKANRLYYDSLSPEDRTQLLIQMINDFYGTEHRLERVPESACVVRS